MQKAFFIVVMLLSAWLVVGRDSKENKGQTSDRDQHFITVLAIIILVLLMLLILDEKDQYF